MTDAIDGAARAMAGAAVTAASTPAIAGKDDVDDGAAPAMAGAAMAPAGEPGLLASNALPVRGGNLPEGTGEARAPAPATAGAGRTRGGAMSRLMPLLLQLFPGPDGALLMPELAFTFVEVFAGDQAVSKGMRLLGYRASPWIFASAKTMTSSVQRGSAFCSVQ